MALRRTITVGFPGANKSIKEVDVTVPSEVIPDTLENASDVLQLSEVKRRLSVMTDGPIFVTISEPFDDDPLSFYTG